MSLAGQLLIAMPGMQDLRFARSVVYLCEHTEKGAMGLVVNKYFDPALTVPELMSRFGIESDRGNKPAQVHFGGPVEIGQGFVLHSVDYVEENHTHLVAGNLALTATLEILRAMGRGKGPRRSLVALGYAGWGAGQLDAEMQANGWLNVAADEEIVFGNDLDAKWQRALAKLGIDLLALSDEAGHA
jgi:putative transcriptional regulator